MVRWSRSADRAISLFVAVWLLVFGYESLRLRYLSPLAGRELPKIKLLFPPAGWIMFYAVSPYYGFAEVYGVKGKTSERLSPHDIFRTKAVGYDNIRRNVMVGVLHPSMAPSFCRYLRWKFPSYDTFFVLEGAYPNVLKSPKQVLGRIAYQCS